MLIQKDKSKGTVASNYRPITCLPLAWKLLTGIFSDEVYRYLEGQELLREEQKGCRRKSKGTGGLLQGVPENLCPVCLNITTK